MKKKLKPLPIWKTPARSIRELQRRVLKLIRLGWTKRVRARDADGHAVDAVAPNACSVCVVGAIDRALPTRQASQAFVHRLATAMGTMFITDFNDYSCSSERVIAAVRRVKV